MRIRHRLILVFGLIGLVCGQARAQSDLPGLLACMRANVPEHGRIQDLELTTLEGGASSQLKARLYGQERPERTSLTLQVRAPADLEGAAWLFRRSRGKDATSTDETFVYLPSVGKVRRVSGGAEDQSLFGTALSYEDVHQLLSSFRGGAMSLGPQTQIAGRPSRRLYVLAAPGAQVVYDKIVAEVDRESCVVLAAELYRNGHLRKRMSAAPESLRRLGPHWYPSLITVEDLQNGVSTELRVLQAELSPRLASRYFEPATFYRE
ncbi:MAG: outer membrane lipoprotein-sorting protein [Sinimarinibacterium sp.]